VCQVLLGGSVHDLVRLEVRQLDLARSVTS
jgi:hypothetical protein